MKHLITIFVVMLSVTWTAQSQVHQFKTTGFAVLEKSKAGGKWSEFQPSAMAITLDTNKNRIVIYSQEIQLYRIESYEPVEESEDDIVYPFACRDDDGQTFTITIITRKKQGNRRQLYINQRDYVIAYNIEVLKN